MVKDKHKTQCKCVIKINFKLKKCCLYMLIVDVKNNKEKFMIKL